MEQKDRAESPSFAVLIRRLRSGDQEAAAEVFERYTRRLIALARRRLGRIQGKLDPQDVLQSVYRSFFLRQAQGKFQLADWDSLWGLLATITLRKCGHWLDHYHAERRDVRRERTPANPSDSAGSWVAVAREPTPEEAAALAETVERIMGGLEGYQRNIFELALQGLDKGAISDRVGYSRRTVQRVLDRVRRRLERLRGESTEKA